MPHPPAFTTPLSLRLLPKPARQKPCHRPPTTCQRRRRPPSPPKPESPNPVIQPSVNTKTTSQDPVQTSSDPTQTPSQAPVQTPSQDPIKRVQPLSPGLELLLHDAKAIAIFLTSLLRPKPRKGPKSKLGSRVAKAYVATRGMADRLSDRVLIKLQTVTTRLSAWQLLPTFQKQLSRSAPSPMYPHLTDARKMFEKLALGASHAVAKMVAGGARAIAKRLQAGTVSAAVLPPRVASGVVPRSPLPKGKVRYMHSGMKGFQPVTELGRVKAGMAGRIGPAGANGERRKGAKGAADKPGGIRRVRGGTRNAPGVNARTVATGVYVGASGVTGSAPVGTGSAASVTWDTPGVTWGPPSVSVRASGPSGNASVASRSAAAVTGNTVHKPAEAQEMEQQPGKSEAGWNSGNGLGVAGGVMFAAAAAKAAATATTAAALVAGSGALAAGAAMGGGGRGKIDRVGTQSWMMRGAGKVLEGLKEAGDKKAGGVGTGNGREIVQRSGGEVVEMNGEVVDVGGVAIGETTSAVLDVPVLGWVLGVVDEVAFCVERGVGRVGRRVGIWWRGEWELLGCFQKD